MLAYVFWHQPRSGVDPSAYESALSGFCAALLEARPPGLTSVSTASVDRAPFDWRTARLDATDGVSASAPAYEDWYLIEDSAALDVIEAAAVGPSCREAHAEVASMAGAGTGGLYRSAGDVAGSPGTPGAWTEATWLDLPSGVGRGEWTRRLEEQGSGRRWWTRTLNLSPAPEFCLPGARPEMAGSVLVSRRPVA